MMTETESLAIRYENLLDRSLSIAARQAHEELLPMLEKIGATSPGSAIRCPGLRLPLWVDVPAGEIRRAGP